MSIKISFPDSSEPFIQLFPRIFPTIYIFVSVSATGSLLIVYMFRRMQQKFARCLKVRIMASFIFIIQYSKLIAPYILNWKVILARFKKDKLVVIYGHETFFCCRQCCESGFGI